MWKTLRGPVFYRRRMPRRKARQVGHFFQGFFVKHRFRNLLSRYENQIFFLCAFSYPNMLENQPGCMWLVWLVWLEAAVKQLVDNWILSCS